MIDKNIIEYRKAHPKCKWCKYRKYNSPSTKISGISCPDYVTCELKDITIHGNWRAIFCNYYIVKDEINE